MTSTAPDLAAIRALEERAFNAWPARQILHYDGWVLGLAEGYTRRANAVYPLYPSVLPVQGKLEPCEQVYTAHGQDTVYKMTLAAYPGDLDQHLEQRGYSREAETLVQTLKLDAGEHSATAGPAVTLASAVPLDVWLTARAAVIGLHSRRRTPMGTMLRGIVPAHVYAAVKQEDGWVAVGRAVLEREFVGLFDVVVAPHAQRRGLGRSVVVGLLAWACAHGATQAYLQVMANNSRALRLYAALGFVENYRYWYRVRPMPPAGEHGSS